jgi:hypothetical protein
MSKRTHVPKSPSSQKKILSSSKKNQKCSSKKDVSTSSKQSLRNREPESSVHSAGGYSTDFVLEAAAESESVSEYGIHIPYLSSGGCMSQASAAAIESNSDWIPCTALEAMSEELVSDIGNRFDSLADIDGPPIRSSKTKSVSKPSRAYDADVDALTHEFSDVDVYNGYNTSDDGETYHKQHSAKRKQPRKPKRVVTDIHTRQLMSQTLLLSDSSGADLPIGPLPSYVASELPSLSDPGREVQSNRIIDHQSSDSWDGATEEIKCGSSDEESKQSVSLKNKEKVKNMLIY